MPSVNLRLSDEQHAELAGAAERNHRSLQKEIIHRLSAGESHWPRPLGFITPQGRAEAARVMVGKEFKGPDPKPGKRK